MFLDDLTASPAAVHALKLACAGSACAMAGLIWFVQLVHYPLMARVGTACYADYQRAHEARTTLVVAPLMLVELATAALLAWLLRSTPQAVLAFIGSALVVLVFVSTFFVQVPLHTRLGGGFDAGVHRRLVGGNWARTLLWTAHAAVALAML